MDSTGVEIYDERGWIVHRWKSGYAHLRKFRFCTGGAVFEIINVVAGTNTFSDAAVLPYLH